MIEKNALEYIVELGNNEIDVIDGRTYTRHPLHLIKQSMASPFTVRSLSGLVDYLKSNFDETGNLMVHIESPTKVSAFNTFNIDKNREVFIQAEALLPEMRFGQWHDAEDFNIKLQSVFAHGGDKERVLRVVGNIRDENVTTFGDDGISQKVTAKMGVATVEDVPVPNPVVLFPYRTFVELKQPESQFVLRLKNGPACALFEADGGAWKVEAMDTVRAHLEEQLADEIASGKIVIIA